MTSRPTVTIIGADGKGSNKSHPLPAVFLAPIRPDIVQIVHTGMAKNKRQPYAVSEKAGHQTSAESWGTGRAVARIPRVSGSGTHRAGQAAFGNMCRSGRMFAPTKVWRKWHQKINLGQKRFATASAVAASSNAALLMARGHNVSAVPEVPLVISSTAFSLTKTAGAVKLLRAVGAGPDIDKVKKSKKLRAGRGKSRGRRFRQRRGPLVVYDAEEDGLELARNFRNIPGVESCPVHSLNLLQLAPGGHLGRFIIWTSAAFAALDKVYGSTTEPSLLKKDFLLPSAVVKQPDLNKLINSSEIQAVLRPTKGSGIHKRTIVQKKNPLRNHHVMLRLNPYTAQYAKDKLGQAKIPLEKKNKLNEDFVTTFKSD
ncbi:putative 60S ribosomal protein L4 [Microthyrium microscopicum]|uniref:Putative 60S ribosomal protein L4 n=1 Tax=Microthyrium microscopicum TaxID=703497 RepID=A0A6A6UBW7_9PEZI|nr:putative 60S ribosomal protein L4 [Microthyrium microscopicum]